MSETGAAPVPQRIALAQGTGRWGTPAPPDAEHRFLQGPQPSGIELLRAFRIFLEFVRGFRALRRHARIDMLSVRGRGRCLPLDSLSVSRRDDAHESAHCRREDCGPSRVVTGLACSLPRNEAAVMPSLVGPCAVRIDTLDRRDGRGGRLMQRVLSAVGMVAVITLAAGCSSVGGPRPGDGAPSAAAVASPNIVEQKLPGGLPANYWPAN